MLLIISQHIYSGGFKMGLSSAAWATLLVPTILGILVMVLYGYWDKITGKEYYVDDEILAYDEDLMEELGKGGKV